MADDVTGADSARRPVRKPAPKIAKLAAIAPALPEVGPAPLLVPTIDVAAPPRHAGHAKKKHKARIEHNIPGRIRMKIPAAKTDPRVLDDYVAAFSALPGVTMVKAKPETGSITLHYESKGEANFAETLHTCCTHHELHVDTAPPEDDINRIASKIAKEADFLADHSPLAKATVDFFKGFDRELKLVSGNTIDLKIFLASGLAGFTFLEIGAAAATPMWVTLALFGVNHFVELQATPPSALPSPVPSPSSGVEGR